MFALSMITIALIRMKKVSFLLLLLLRVSSLAQVQTSETNLTGVYQGKTLFIQNPFNSKSRNFCIDKIYINKDLLDINYKLSAIKLDFEGIDLFTPISIRIQHRDTLCSPIIINPEAILFHTIFRFTAISLSDSAISWSTKGERGVGSFEVERLDGIRWITKEVVDARGVYEGATYTLFPNMEDGANQYRIKYNFPRGSRSGYLYSWEVDYDYYPEPVEFKPKSAKTRIYLSRAATYKIYDAGSEMVLEGAGTEIDVTVLRKGQYVIYFDEKYPGTFFKE
jgi:hypothetical protein